MSTSAVTSTAPSLASAVEPSALLPLQSQSDRMLLELPEAPRSELRIPLGATQPAAVVIVLENPGEQVCDAWHAATGRKRFVLCQTASTLRSVPDVQLDVADTAIRAGLRAVKRRFGGYASGADLAIAGTGTTASLVVEIVRRAPETFSRIVLVDGGFSSWSAVDSGRLGRAAASRALLLCGSIECKADARRVFATMRASSIPVRLRLDLPGSLSDGGVTRHFPADYGADLEWVLAAQ